MQSADSVSSCIVLLCVVLCINSNLYLFQKMEPEQEDDYCACSQESSGHSSGADTADTEPVAPEPFELPEGAVQAVPEWPGETSKRAELDKPSQEPVPPLQRTGPMIGLDPQIWSPVARRQFEEAQRMHALPGCSHWGQELQHDPDQAGCAPMVTDERFTCQDPVSSSSESPPGQNWPEGQHSVPEPPSVQRVLEAPRKRRRVVLEEPRRKINRELAISLLQQIHEDWPDLGPQAQTGDPTQVSGWPCEQRKVTFRCDMCWKQYASKASLGRHIQTYHWGRKYRCQECLQYWTNKEDVKNHQQITGHEGQDIIYLYGNLAGGEMFPAPFQ